MLSRDHAALLGHVAGTRLLSAEQLAAAAAYTGRDQVMEMDQLVARLQPLPARRRPLAFGLDLRDGRHRRIGGLRRHRHRVAIALMRNRFSPDFTAIASLDDIVAKAYPPPANPEDRNP